MATKAKRYQPGFLIDNQAKICNAFRSGKKTVELEGTVFAMRKTSHTVKVTTAKNPEGVMVLEHWLSVFPADGSFYPKANIAYPHSGANSRTDLL